MKTFDIFSTFSGLKPNKSKCEIAGLGALKAVKLALYGMKCIDLMFNAIKILRVYYSYDKNFENQEKFINLVLKIEIHLSLFLECENDLLQVKLPYLKLLQYQK